MSESNDYAVLFAKRIQTIAVELESWPAELIAFEYLHESFGGWYMIVRRSGQRFRYDYDGKDPVLSVERLTRDTGDYSKRPVHITDLEFTDEFDADSLTGILEFVRRTSRT